MGSLDLQTQAREEFNFTAGRMIVCGLRTRRDSQKLTVHNI